jgi:class 3 adenylate cyclase/tetratricopeptide (TPR) repeat protein
MSEIRNWLDSIGLGQYGDAFDANEIGMDLLGQVDDQMLKDIGVSIGGHRLRIRNAIAKLTPAPVAEVNLSSATSKHETTAPSAQRRQLTVMFCDLVGSTALSSKLDPEDLRSIITAYHRCCTAMVERNGGFVAKYMGDGVLAYFGYPQAHEHDAERAVRAGLALAGAVPKLATTAGSPLQVRVGIATGLVVVGDLIGAGAAQEQAVVGETPNLAARLQALAGPGAVVIAAATRRLTGGLFHYRDLGTMALKGFAENVPAWQVLGADATESRFEALRATTTPLIGRDEEIDLLMRRWEGAKRGEGSVVLISGEPGIGKSRIAQTIVDRLSNEPHTRLRYFCSPHHQDSAFHPSIMQLERAAGFRRDDTDEQRLDKLEAVLTQGTNDLSEVLPLLADLLSIPIGHRYPPLNVTPQKRKEKTLNAQVAQVEGLSSRQPLLMVFEDIHWSDPTTREWLDLLIDRVPRLRVLLIITFRPESAPPWVGRPHVTMLTLNRLPPRQRGEMIVFVTGGKTLPREIADQIVDRTDGVPLFIEELTKSVVESGILTETGGGYAASGPVTALAIPTTLHASLLARLDRLAPTREVAQIGAALGRSFSYELISTVIGMPQHELDDALDQLVRAELIFRRGTPPDAEYTFKHALVQDAAYSTLLRGRRQQLHARIAETLERQFPEIVATEPALLAQHCAEAGLNEKVVAYRLAAGQQALARSAMTEAVAQLRRGLDLLSQLPEGAQRQQHELDLQVTIARAQMATRGFAAPEVGEACARARQLCDQLNRPHFVPMLWAEWAHHFLRAELDRARHGAEEMLNLGETRNEVPLKVVGHQTLGLTRFSLGDFVGSRGNLERALALFDPADLAYYTALNPSKPSLVVQLWLSRTLGWLGYLDRAGTQMESTLTEARQIGHEFTTTHALVEICIAEWCMCAPETLLARANELLSLAAEQFTMFEAQGMMIRGWCLTALGQKDGALLAKRGLAAFRATGSSLWVPFYLTLLADAYGNAAKPEEGLACLDDAARLVEVTHECSNDAEMHRVRGKLLILLRDIPAATSALLTSIQIAGRQQARLFELRTAIILTRLWRDQGKRTEARDLLAPVYGWFTEGFDTPVLQDAKTLLGEL